MAATACGCNSDFLKEDPKAMQTVQQKYQTQSDFEMALIGVYNALSSPSVPVNVTSNFGNYRLGVLNLGECGTDEVFAANNQRTNEIALDSYTISSSDPSIVAHYGCMYQIISRANEIISRLDDGRELAGDWQGILGEALFLRALGYFNLVRSYGGVPLVTVPVDVDSWKIGTVRASVEDVYTQIISDLNRAGDMLGATARNGEVGRATSAAAHGLLARVYLHAASMKNVANIDASLKLGTINSYDWLDAADWYAAACDQCQQVFALQGLSAAAPLTGITYAGNFWPNKNGPESLFEMQFSTSFTMNLRGLVGRVFGIPGSSDNGANWLKAMGNEYYGTCDDADARTTMNVLKFHYNAAGALVSTNNTNQWGFMKYNTDYSDARYGGNNTGTPQNFPVIRTAEIALIYAEAQAELAELGDARGSYTDALAMLNHVRARSNMPAIPVAYITDPLPVDGTQAQRNDIYKYLKPISGIVSMAVSSGNVGAITITAGELDTPIKRFRAFLLNELKWEFIGEGHRWFDLVRLGKLKQINDAIDARLLAGDAPVDNLKQPRAVQSYYIFRPLPQVEADLGVQQNFGY